MIRSLLSPGLACSILLFVLPLLAAAQTVCDQPNPDPVLCGDLCSTTQDGTLCWDDTLGVPTGNCWVGTPGLGAACTAPVGSPAASGEMGDFLWVGVANRNENWPLGPKDNFSQAELCELASTYQVVTLSPSHGGLDPDGGGPMGGPLPTVVDPGKQKCAARLLKSLNPDLRVLLTFHGESLINTSPWWEEFIAEPEALPSTASGDPWCELRWFPEHAVPNPNPANCTPTKPCGESDIEQCTVNLAQGGPGSYRAWSTTFVTNATSPVVVPEVVAGEQQPGARWSGAPWSGVMFDLAYGTAHYGNLIRSKLSDPDAVYEGLSTLLQETKVALAQQDPDSIVMFNGLDRHNSPEKACLWRHTRPFGSDPSDPLNGGEVCADGSTDIAPATLSSPDGVHNEYFCVEKGPRNTGVTPTYEVLDPDFFRRDLAVQRDLVRRGHWTVAKFNYRAEEDEATLEQPSRYCYGSYLMAHEPGLTAFKRGAVTNPTAIGEVTAEQTLELGRPLGDFVVGPGWPSNWPDGTSTTDGDGGGLLWREFDNYWVVTNLDRKSTHDFVIPEQVEAIDMVRVGDAWIENLIGQLDAGDMVAVGQDVAIVPGEKLAMGKRDAAFFKKPALSLPPGVAQCSAGLRHDRYTGGNLGWTGRVRTSLEPACCNIQTSCTDGDTCYPEGVVVSRDDGTEDACLDTTGFGPGFYTCDASTLGQTIERMVDGVPVPTYICTTVCAQAGPCLDYRFEPVNFDAQASSSTCPGGQSVGRQMGVGFGEDWATRRVHGKFDTCCDPQQACNQGTCYPAGTRLPQQRETDQICAKTAVYPVNGNVGLAVHNCSSVHVESLIHDQATGIDHCCTEPSPGLFRFEHASHEACSGPGLCSRKNQERNMAADFGTDWRRRETQGAFNLCCDTNSTCNTGAQCQALGTILPPDRFGEEMICADSGEGPTLFACTAVTAGQTLEASTGIQCCQASTNAAGDPVHNFVAGACP